MWTRRSLPSRNSVPSCENTREAVAARLQFLWEMSRWSVPLYCSTIGSDIALKTICKRRQVYPGKVDEAKYIVSPVQMLHRYAAVPRSMLSKIRVSALKNQGGIDRF